MVRSSFSASGRCFINMIVAHDDSRRVPDFNRFPCHQIRLNLVLILLILILSGFSQLTLIRIWISVGFPVPAFAVILLNPGRF